MQLHAKAVSIVVSCRGASLPIRETARQAASWKMTSSLSLLREKPSRRAVASSSPNVQMPDLLTRPASARKSSGRRKPNRPSANARLANNADGNTEPASCTASRSSCTSARRPRSRGSPCKSSPSQPHFTKRSSATTRFEMLSKARLSSATARMPSWVRAARSFAWRRRCTSVRSWPAHKPSESKREASTTIGLRTNREESTLVATLFLNSVPQPV
mmetsp:Transcript_100286/g.282925  ORF Transcript_100286/g.282925 Transcript_100286/m.282925 type:complete len:216 (+) Transcript_100286:2-649(+)